MLLGKTRPVVLPYSGLAMPLKPQAMPSVLENRFVVSMIRASIITCGSGVSRVSMTVMMASMKVGSSLMISVLVRLSTTTEPRWLIRLAPPPLRSSPAMSLASA